MTRKKKTSSTPQPVPPHASEPQKYKSLFSAKQVCVYALTPLTYDFGRPVGGGGLFEGLKFAGGFVGLAGLTDAPFF